MKSGIDLYVFAERSVFETDERWLAAIAELAAIEVAGLALQVRTKSERPDRALELARRAREATLNARVPVLLNGSTAEAVALGYEGVHWPEALIPEAGEGVPLSLTLSPKGRGDMDGVRPARTGNTDAVGRGDADALGPGGRALVRAASVHSVEACLRGEAAGADLVVAGTIFDAGSKPVAGEGLEKLHRIVEATRLPVLAIGGVRPDRVAACIEAGAAGVAVVTGVLRAPDMAAAVRELREALDASRPAAGASARRPGAR